MPSLRKDKEVCNIDSDGEVKRKGGYFHQRFMKVLLLNSVSKTEEEAIDEWMVAGGHYEKQIQFTSFEKPLEETTHKPTINGKQYYISYLYYIRTFSNIFDAPAFVNECICTHGILQNCFIYNKLNGNVLVVGNCCIDRFLIDKNKLCNVCLEPFDNTRNSLCSICFELGKKKIHFGRYGKETIKPTIWDVYQNNYGYFQYLLMNRHKFFGFYGKKANIRNSVNYVNKFLDRLMIRNENIFNYRKKNIRI
jgi:hypothetical protein